PFMLIAGAFGSIILLIILRLSARFGVKQVIGTIAVVYGSAIMLFYYFTSPVKLVNQVFEHFPNINNYFGSLENPIIKFLPNYWISESLYWISRGNLTPSAWYIYILIVTSVVILLTAILIARKWYYK